MATKALAPTASISSKENGSYWKKLCHHS